MANKCNKNKAVINRLLLAETDAGKKQRVTKPTVPQASLESTNMQGKATSITNTSSEALRILHQNIQGLRWKSNEVIDSVYHSLPHILCFTEHHLNRHEINLIQIDNYTLGAFFCRNSFKMGGVRVCIFVNKNLNFMNIDLQ